MEQIRTYFVMWIKSFDIYIFWIHLIRYFLFFSIVWIIIFSFLLKKNRTVWLNVVLWTYGFVLIWWLFAKGKTRMLSMIAYLWKTFKKETFIISNYDNGYSDLFYSSLEDFINILNDLIYLWDYQNFSNSERKEILNKFPDYFGQNDYESFKKKYKYIPTNGYHNNFLLLGDEFHQYFYNTDSAFFWTEKWKILLQTLHQIRHYNTFCVLATQELDELALKFRKLASYEIETETIAGGLMFNSYIYERNRKNKYSSETTEEKEYRKINKKPIYFLNWFLINKIIFKLNKFWIWFITKFYWYKGEFFRIIKPLNVLNFKSKFNVKVNINTYVPWSLFEKINLYYKKNNKNLTN